MPRPDDHIKEDINRAYVAAVVAQAGYTCHFIDHGDYGTDVQVNEVQLFPDGSYCEVGFHFKAQLKSSHAHVQNIENTVYDMKVDAYNRMLKHTASPLFLILFCTPPPPQSATRIAVSEQMMELRNCCYWYDRPTTITTNSGTVRLKIPRAQLFTPLACQDLMQRVKDGNFQ